MATKPRFKSDISGAIHASAAMLNAVAALERATMRDFDERHLDVPTGIEPAQIEQLRGCSPAISTHAKARSRHGRPAPNGMALKLLSVLRMHGLLVRA
ncbi:helix-turn-helix domain-containing protein [Reyranella sp.]|uniref:helix-turn-helix domain-containing protein n=1 Tax=Reyranella sp. TaxID=1929291 RepID=UPI003D0DDB97